MEMKNVLNLIFLGILGYNVWDKVKGDLNKLQNWEYRITNLFFNKLTATQIKGMVVWDFINKSPQAGGIKNVSVDILFNDKVIGSISAPGEFQIPGNGSTEIRTAFSLDLAAVGAKALPMLQAIGSNKDIPLILQGSAKVRAGSGFYITLPIKIATSAKTILTYFN